MSLKSLTMKDANYLLIFIRLLQCQVVRNLPVNAGDARDVGLVPESRRSSRVGNGNPLQHSCLENSMDRRTWQSTVHAVAKSQGWLSMSAIVLPVCSSVCVRSVGKLSRICWEIHPQRFWLPSISGFSFNCATWEALTMFNSISVVHTTWKLL